MAQLEEKKKKKVCSSTTYTTGDIGYNISQFNKHMGSTDSNNPSTAEDGGVGNNFAGSGEGCSEGLNEDAILSKKMNGYVELPPKFHLLDPVDVSAFIKNLKIKQPFTVCYITPIYFYKQLLDKFTLLKVTQMTGYTGVDARDAANVIQQQKGVDADARAAEQAADPTGHTDYNTIMGDYSRSGIGLDYNDSGDDAKYANEYNTENNRVKSRIPGMRKEYDDINKTVKQGDLTIYEQDPKTGRLIRDANGKPIIKYQMTDMKTILFQPETDSMPQVKYFLDMKDGNGYFEVARDILEKTIYKKVKEITLRDEKLGRLASGTMDKVVATLASDRATTDSTVLSNSDAYKGSYRALYTNQILYLDNISNQIYSNEVIKLGTPINELKESLKSEARPLTEKRETKRYYVRPQDIFCANKADVLKALVDVYNAGENCSVYSLKDLADHDDVHQLSNDDIIYYYDEGVLKDKNKVPVLDYDLFIKHEEERPKVSDNGKDLTKAEWNNNYDDRMTQNTELEESTTDRKYVGLQHGNIVFGPKSATSDEAFMYDFTDFLEEKGYSEDDFDDEEFAVMDLSDFKSSVDGNYKDYMVKLPVKNMNEAVNIYDIRDNPDYDPMAVSKFNATAHDMRDSDYYKNGTSEDREKVNAFLNTEYKKTVQNNKLPNEYSKVGTQYQIYDYDDNGEVAGTQYGGRLDIDTSHNSLDKDRAYWASGEGREMLGQTPVDYDDRQKEFAGYTDDEIQYAKDLDAMKQYQKDHAKEVAKDNKKRNLFNIENEDINNPFDMMFEDYDAYGNMLVEGKTIDTCCICGEPIEGYGNNADPYMDGTCCDACNLKFVIPARLNIKTNINDNDDHKAAKADIEDEE